MTVYEYKPEKSNTRIFGLMIIFLSVGAAFFISPLLLPSLPFHWLFQLLGIIAIITVIYLLTRYVAKSFVYAVIEDNGALDFTVTEITNGGRRATTVCRISVFGITELKVFDMRNGEQRLREKEIVAAAHQEKRKCFDYCHDINTSPVCVILCEEGGEPLLLKIASDSRLVEFLGNER